MNPIQEDILMHYGVKRRSGRYPWGSGENPFQHGGDFLSRVEELQAQGKSEKEIADELKMSTTDLRMQVRVAKHERRTILADRAKSLREEGKTLDEIAKIMGYNNDSSVRALLNENTASNKNKARQTAERLKQELAEKGALDVGTGAERELGVSTGVLQEALFILERTYLDAKGREVQAKTKAKLLNATDDIKTLSSGTLVEDAYAEYANKMKALANKARIEYVNTPTLARSASAAKTYQPEVDRLTSALRTAQLNAPREREAQRIANARVQAKIKDNNITDKDEISKIRRASISDARIETGANGKETRITISDGEWEAIQAGAISDTTLKEILRYADPDIVRERATPRTRTEVSEARANRIRAMANSGHTNAEIADALNLSPSSVSRILNE